MKPQRSHIDVLEQALSSASSWLHAFDNKGISTIDQDTFDAYLRDVSVLEEIGIDISPWTNIHRYPLFGTGYDVYDYSLFGIRLRSLVSFLERQLERQKQIEATAGNPLTDSQLDLLHDLVMANRNVAASQRQEIVGITADGQTTFFHPGLPDRSLTPNMSDLKRLSNFGLVSAYDRGGRKGWIVDILPAGEATIHAVGSRFPTNAPDSSGQKQQPPDEYVYHVAISYAGPDIQHASDLATLLEQDGYKVFFAKQKRAELWGKNLQSHLQIVFRQQALFCVLFVSEEYKNRIWTNKELQDALDRQIKQQGDEYILPIQLEPNVSLPGLPDSISYVSINEFSIDEIRDLLVKKIDNRLNA